VEKEIEALIVESLAVQHLLTRILWRLAKADARCADAIKAGFDDAANDAEYLSTILGETVSATHHLKALRHIEALRDITLGTPNKPRRRV